MPRSVDTPSDEVVAWLERPSSYEHPVETVETCETHISRVFLAGEFAYKLKKPVELGFLDYSTLALRRAACEDEVRLNRRLAPDVYLGVLAVERRSGELTIGRGDDEAAVVEWLVHMRRIPDDALLSSMVARDAAEPGHVERVADRLVEFHEAAHRGEEIDLHGRPEAIRRTIVETLDIVGAGDGEVSRDVPGDAPNRDASRLGALRSSLLAFLTLEEPLFERRIAQRRICEGHGDLRCEHVAFLPDPAVLDGVEFSLRLRATDVASDLAFLRMDLEFLGRADLARRLLARYVEKSGDAELDRVLDFYASYRASVRAKVESIRLRQGSVSPAERAAGARRARRFLELAYFHAMRLGAPVCVLVGGLSGTGKSTVAAGLAERLGARVLRSDVVRREITRPVGDDATFDGARRREDADALDVPHGFREGRYDAATTERVYEEILARTAALLSEGNGVVVDATFSTERHRSEWLELCHAVGARHVHLECRVDEAVARERMAARRREGRDVSEAGPEIQRAQAEAYQRATGAVPIDTSPDPEAVLDSAVRGVRRSLAGGASP